MLYNKDVEKCCAVCAFATDMSNPNEQICKKNGPVYSDFKCHAFKYDATRRKPRKKAELQTFSGESFTLTANDD